MAEHSAQHLRLRHQGALICEPKRLDVKGALALSIYALSQGPSLRDSRHAVRDLCFHGRGQIRKRLEFEKAVLMHELADVTRAVARGESAQWVENAGGDASPSGQVAWLRQFLSGS
jgi:hypothetical protein